MLLVEGKHKQVVCVGNVATSPGSGEALREAPHQLDAAPASLLEALMAKGHHAPAPMSERSMDGIFLMRWSTDEQTQTRQAFLISCMVRPDADLL